MTVNASSTARTAVSAIPNQSSSDRSHARSRPRTAVRPPGCVRARARLPPRYRQAPGSGTWGPCGPWHDGTRGTRSSGRTTTPCSSPRRSHGVRKGVAQAGSEPSDAASSMRSWFSAGDCDRVELDRPEPSEDLEHPVQASRERPRKARGSAARRRKRRAAAAVTFTRRTLTAWIARTLGGHSRTPAHASMISSQTTRRKRRSACAA